MGRCLFAHNYACNASFRQIKLCRSVYLLATRDVEPQSGESRSQLAFITCSSSMQDLLTFQLAVPEMLQLAEAHRQGRALSLLKMPMYVSGMTWVSFLVPWHQSDMTCIPQMWQPKSWWVLPSSEPSLGLSLVVPSCCITAGVWQLDSTASSSLSGHSSWPSLPAYCKAQLPAPSLGNSPHASPFSNLIHSVCSRARGRRKC